MPGVDHDRTRQVVGVDCGTLGPGGDQCVEAGVDIEVAGVGSVPLRTQLADASW